MPTRQSNKGFTLIELITVIVILSILAVIGSQFIVSSTESYDKTQTRARLQATGRQALERMARELRGALTYSTRITNSGSCIEFVPIVYSGFYLNAVSTSGPTSEIGVAADLAGAQGWGASGALADAESLVIAALSADEVYGNTSGARAAITSIDTANNTINHSTHQWLRNSNAQRYFLVDTPRAFCLNAGRLVYYNTLDWVASTVSGTPHSVIAQNVSAEGSAFTVGLETQTNRSRVTVSLRFAHGDESVAMSQQVAVRNVP